MNPFFLSATEKQELLDKREAIRLRLKNEGQDTITLEEQKIFIQCEQALRTEAFVLNKEKQKTSKKKLTAQVDLLDSEEIEKPKKPKKLSAKAKKARIKELETKFFSSDLTEEEKEELKSLY